MTQPKCGKCGRGMTIGEDMWYCEKCHRFPVSAAKKETKISELKRGLDEQDAAVRGLAEENARLERELAEARGARCAHGWKGTVPERGARIQDTCPSCGLKALFIGSGGHLTCGNLSCEEPVVRSSIKNLHIRAHDAEVAMEEAESARDQARAVAGKYRDESGSAIDYDRMLVQARAEAKSLQVALDWTRARFAEVEAERDERDKALEVIHRCARDRFEWPCNLDDPAEVRRVVQERYGDLAFIRDHADTEKRLIAAAIEKEKG